MIRINNLSYSYNADMESVLNDINLRIDPGEHVAVIGPNGCGKTTLIRHINALLLPTSGEVIIDGLDSRKLQNHREIRCRVGMLFQNADNQIVGMSVEEDVAFGPGNLRLPSSEISRRVKKALEMVGLNGFEKRRPHTLSGGEKQLLALAGLLAMEPSYIVMDESTSSLDPQSRERVLDILDQLKQQEISIIQVTHNMDEALQTERVVLMENGRIVADGGASNILADRELLKPLGLSRPLILELIAGLKPDGYITRDIKTVDEAITEIKLWQRQYLERGGGDNEGSGQKCMI